MKSEKTMIQQYTTGVYCYIYHKIGILVLGAGAYFEISRPMSAYKTKVGAFIHGVLTNVCNIMVKVQL